MNVLALRGSPCTSSIENVLSWLDWEDGKSSAYEGARNDPEGAVCKGHEWQTIHPDYNLVRWQHLVHFVLSLSLTLGVVLR